MQAEVAELSKAGKFQSSCKAKLAQQAKHAYNKYTTTLPREAVEAHSRPKIK